VIDDVGFDPDAAVLRSDEKVCPGCRLTYFLKLSDCPNCKPLTIQQYRDKMGIK
jgi:hypothetical protein